MLSNICIWLAEGLSGDRTVRSYLETLERVLQGPVANDICTVWEGRLVEHQSLKAQSLDVPIDQLLTQVRARTEKLSSDPDIVIHTTLPWTLESPIRRERIIWVRLVFHSPAATVTPKGPFAPRRYNPRAEAGDISVVIEDEFHPNELQLEKGAIAKLIQGLLQSTSTGRLLVCRPADAGSGAFCATHLYHLHARDFLRDVMRQLFLLESYLLGWAEVAAIGPPTRTIPSADLCYGDPSLHRVEELCTSARLSQIRTNCRQAMALLRDKGEVEVAQVAEFNGKYLFPLCNDPEAIQRCIREAADDVIRECLEACGDAQVRPMPSGFLLKVNTVAAGETLHSSLNYVARQICNPHFNWRGRSAMST